MTISLKKVRAKLSKNVVRAADKKTKKLMDKMNLSAVRQLCGVTQEELASKLEIKQSTLSRFENRKNMRIETLMEHIEAMGGELQIQAVFKDFIIPLHIKH